MASGSIAGFHPQDRVGLFIDGANFYGASKALGLEIDYKALLAWASEQSRLVRAFYYTTLFDDYEFSPIRPLVDWLEYNGFTIITKAAREYVDAHGNKRVKGNVDIDIAIDMLEMSDRLDHAVLFSGDGCFCPLVEAVQRRGIKVSVISTLKTDRAMVSDDLRRQADQFIDLMDISDKIGKQASGDPAEYNI